MRVQPKTFLILLIVLNLLALAGYVLIRYWSGEREARIVFSAVEIENELQRGEVLLAAKKIIQGTAEDRIKLEGYFITGDNEVGFIELIEEMGHLSGTELEVKSVAIEPSENKIETLIMMFEAEGTWSEQLQLLALIETLPKALEIQSVTLDTNVSASKESSGIWKSKFIIRVQKLK